MTKGLQSANGDSPRRALMRSGGLGDPIQGKIKSYRHANYGGTLDRQERQELVNTFGGIYQGRDQLMRALKSVQGLDASQTILDVIIDDGFSASQEMPLTVEYAEPQRAVNLVDGETEDPDEVAPSVETINKEIQELLTRVKLVKLIESILEDLLSLGEYPVRLARSADGKIQSIEDDVDPKGMIAVARQGEVGFFLEKKGDKIYTRKAEEYHMFSISPRKIRLEVNDFRDQSRRRLPNYIRCGRSVLYPALSKLKRLQVFELASVAKNLNRILTPKMVGITVPERTQGDDLTELVKRYERILLDNRSQSTNAAGEVDLTELMASIGRIKVLPIFGDGKGTLSSIEIDGVDASEAETENSLRRMVALAAGIPSYYLSVNGENASTKVESLKLYSRYSRKLVSIQASLAESIRELVHDDLSSKGKTVRKELIIVKFKSIVNVDVLDTIEYAVASTTVFSQLFANLEAVANSHAVNIKINSEKLILLFESLSSTFAGARGLLEIDNEPEVVGDDADGEGGSPATPLDPPAGEISTATNSDTGPGEDPDPTGGELPPEEAPLNPAPGET